jgi:hypothetical protein
MTIVTKTKRVRVEEIRFTPEWENGSLSQQPSQQEQTRQRRAFLAAEKTRKEAEGFECKITGKGSYERVVVYQITAVEGRMQERGVCQGCGGSVAVDEHQTSLHGYQRPGFGYTIGRCPGAQKQAANFSIEFAKELIAGLRATAVGMREGAATREATELVVAKATLNALYAIEPMDESKPARDERIAAGKEKAEIEKLIRDARWMADQNDNYAKHLEATALPALGTPLTTVVLPA